MGPSSDCQAWQPAPSVLELAVGEAHVWRIQLDSSPGEADRDRGLLDETERNRAARFVFEPDRARYVGAHAALRLILSRYLNAPPRTLQFRNNSYGKPHLVDSSLGFNLAHSGGLGVVAVCLNPRVGVDVEQIRAPQALDSTQVYFSPREHQAIMALPGEKRGQGLSFGLQGFSVAVRGDEPAALLDVDGDAMEASRWTLADLALGPRYAGALAVEGALGQVRLWNWTGHVQI